MGLTTGLMSGKIQNNLPDKRQFFIYMSPVSNEALRIGETGEKESQVRRLNQTEREEWARISRRPVGQIHPDSIIFLSTDPTPFDVATEYFRRSLPQIRSESHGRKVPIPGGVFEPADLTVNQDFDIKEVCVRFKIGENLFVVSRTDYFRSSRYDPTNTVGFQTAMLACVSAGFYETARPGDLIVVRAVKERQSPDKPFREQNVNILRVADVEIGDEKRKVVVSDESGAREWVGGNPPENARIFVIDQIGS
ncbi:MAG: hypothetical protein Q8N98_03020 [bacterium]|nr:hypothetical protein [bacterium]